MISSVQLIPSIYPSLNSFIQSSIIYWKTYFMLGSVQSPRDTGIRGTIRESIVWW